MTKKNIVKQIICKLRQAKVLSDQGKTFEEMRRLHDISDATYHKRRKEYGDMGIDQARR